MYFLFPSRGTLMLHHIILYNWNKGKKKRGRRVSYPQDQHKKIQTRGGHCVQISGYTPKIFEESAAPSGKRHVPPLSQPPWMRNGSKECSIIVLSEELGEGREACSLPSFSCVQNHVFAGGKGVVVWGVGTGLQTRNWAEQPPPQLTRPCTSSFV